MIHVLSFSPQVTKRIGVHIANYVVSYVDLSRGPAIIFLEGNLGGGKTTFTSGVLAHFGIRASAVSPTFVLMKRYATKKYRSAVREIVHIDAYRLQSKKDLDALDFRTVSTQPHTLIFIEWADRLRGARIRPHVRMRFTHGETIRERDISIDFSS
jgi:tRNA threonylcarbamoyl adenosine modification protein YjeE